MTVVERGLEREEVLIGPSAPGRGLTSSTFAAVALAGGLATLAAVLGWRGTDTAAHVFRVGLLERDGFHVWNNYWFGGHHTPGYSLLFPLLGSLVGIWTVAVLAAASSALLFDLFVRKATGRASWFATLWFAAGTVTNVAIGRLPFALGLAVAMGALLAASHGRRRWAAVLSILCAAASPVSGAFLALLWAAWAIVATGRERMSRVTLVGCALGPVIVMSLVYPQGGSFPFRWSAFVWVVVVSALVALLVDERVVRVAAGLYAIAALVTFVVPTPLGGNLSRLGMYAAGPTLAALVPLKRLAIAVVVPVLLWWQWSPAMDAIFVSGRDPSTQERYYRPLLQFLHTVDADAGRVEVVPTRRHWEATYVALSFPIARGWERQLDIRYNPIFYEPELPLSEYRQWLREEGVRYVALSDAELDPSGELEAQLVEDGAAFLRPVWSGRHWRVWEVVSSTGMIDGPAEVVQIEADSVWFDVRVAGDVKLRVRPSAYWMTEPPLCVETTDDDWIVIRDAQPGLVQVFIDESDLISAEDPCVVPAPG